MAIKSLNKKIIGLTGSGSFGPVPSGKEWIIKMALGAVTTGGSVAPIALEIDGVKIAETSNIGGLGDVRHLVSVAGSFSGPADIPGIAFATDGQAVDVIRGSGGGFTWESQIHYLERDIPTP